jgi:hypothetical protein
MEVGMMHEILTPGMENADHSYGSTEMFWVVSELGQCFGGRAKEQIIEELLVQ